MSIKSKLKSWWRGAEGSQRGTFYGQGELGGWHALNPLENGWQRNLDIEPFSLDHVPAVYASVMLIARSISQCYPVHKREGVNGEMETVQTSAASRILRNPNSYQSGTDFILNMVSEALFHGEAFAVCTRNDRHEINSIHPLARNTCSPMVDEYTQTIFYSIGSNPLSPVEIDYIAPAEDIWHLKFHTPRHPLCGESPVKAAALAAGIHVAMSRNQQAFFAQNNRPSGILSTDQALNSNQMSQLRHAFDEQSKAWAMGGMPILGNGLKFTPMSLSSADAQVIETLKWTTQEIARCFGVPPAMIGDAQAAAQMGNTQTLVNTFMSTSLGSYLEQIERQLDRLFGLPNFGEYIELDTSALLRVDMRERIESLGRGVQMGIFSPNEARRMEGMSPLVNGDQVFLQQQMTPIDLLYAVHESAIASKLGIDNVPNINQPNGLADREIEFAGKSIGWNFTGVKDPDREYSVGDVFIENGSSFVWLGDKAKMIAQRGKDAKPADVAKALAGSDELREVVREMMSDETLNALIREHMSK